MKSLSRINVKPTWQRRKERISTVWALFKQSRVGVLGIVILVIFLVLALASPIPPKIDELYIPLYGTDPEIIGFTHPSLRHPLGTDFMRRDLFSQLLEGAFFWLSCYLIGIGTRQILNPSPREDNHESIRNQKSGHVLPNSYPGYTNCPKSSVNLDGRRYSPTFF
ncbi:MAG: hypothetical protein HXS48_25165 [Theionarchaea archaeon]|nr:MAG: hypothetical protein AYK19_05595 [Theionarchaea archaeon DG-70-1]MBU7030248.1 hypothetical protein [Theionarchaea archaeon]